MQDSICVHEDSALFILEGVTLEFEDSAYLRVNGYLSAIGTPNDSIIFRNAHNTWQGLRIFHSDSVYSDNLLFYFCEFRHANASNDFLNGGALSIEYRDDISIFNCSFVNNYAEERGGAVYMLSSDVMIKNTRFESNSTGITAGSSKGGAVYVHNSEATFKDILFQNNQSLVAGAMYSDNASIDILDCIFKLNTSLAGGGAFVGHKSGVLTFDDCLFEDNYANGSGGAIAFLEAIWARLRNCTIQYNTSESEEYLSDGGGVLITPYDNQVTFINSEISGNTAGDYGGGVYATSNSDFINCLFVNNMADLDTIDEGGGGAIAMSLSHNRVLNCTFTGNYGGEGSSILCEDASFSLINNIIWDDSISPDPKIFLSTVEDPPEIYVSHCDIEGGNGVIRGTGAYVIDWASGNIDVDPLFVIPGTDFALSNESPCMDTGRADTLQLLIPPTDIARNQRIYRGEIDMGCYENQFPFGIEELKADDNILVYPNPAADYFYLRNNSGEDFNGRLAIADLSGRVLLQKEVNIVNGSSLRQALSHLPSGIYIINLSSDHQSYSGKLLLGSKK